MSESVTTKDRIPKKIFAPGTIVTIERREGMYITKDSGGAERIDGVPQPDGTIKMRCGLIRHSSGFKSSLRNELNAAISGFPHFQQE